MRVDRRAAFDGKIAGMKLPALILFLASLSPALRAETPATSIRGSLEAFVRDGSLSGAVAVVYQNNRTVSEEVVGFRDLESNSPMQALSCAIRSPTRTRRKESKPGTPRQRTPAKKAWT